MARRSDKRENIKSKDFRKKSKKGISHKDVKRTKIKIQKLNKDESLTLEILDCAGRGRVRDSPLKFTSLHAKTLKKDQQRDKEVQGRAEAKKIEMNDSLEKQIEEISSFSL